MTMKVEFSSAIRNTLKVEVQIESARTRAVGGADYPRLFVLLHISVKGIDPKSRDEVYSVQLGAIQGELLFNGQKISDSLPRQLDHLVYEFDRDEQISIEFPLDTRRVEWIERQRHGSLQGSVRVSISTLVLGKERGIPSQSVPTAFRDSVAICGEVPFTVPDSHWREQVLPALGYGKVIAFELPAIPIESFQALDHSFKAMSQAQKLFQIGHYDDAAAKCRTALEQFFESVEVSGDDGSKRKVPVLKKSWEARLGKATYNWLSESLSAIKDAANKPHHSSNNHFDRLGAQMLMMITTALISYAANSLSNEES